MRPLSSGSTESSLLVMSPAYPYRTLSRLASNIVVLIGCLALLGWFLDFAVAKRIDGGVGPEKANTASALILSAVSLRLLGRQDIGTTNRLVAQACAGLVVCIGLLTLYEHLTGIHLGFDQLFVDDVDDMAAPHVFRPERMCLATAVCFVLFGSALLLLTGQRYTLAQWLALLGGFIALLALIGYAYDAASLYRVYFYKTIALHTVGAFIALSLGILFAASDQALMRIVTGDTVGGMMVRGLLPAAILIPMGSGWLELLGERFGNYDSSFGSALLVLFTILTLCGLIYRNARALHVIDTRRKRAETDLSLAEAKYRGIFEHAIDGIYQSLPAGQLITANPALAQMLGYSSADDMTTTVTHVEQQFYAEPGHYASLMRWLEARDRVHAFETQLLCKDGRKIWVLMNMYEVCDASGQQLYYEGMIKDISERMQLEEQLRQAQKMEAIGRLSGGIAHDFNNLLTAINGFSEMLLYRLDEHQPMRREIEEINKAGRRAAGLTHQLLAFSRAQILQPRVFALNAVVVDMETMLRRVIGEDIELIVRLDPSPGHMKADRGQVEQVIMNLAINAKDAMPYGGMLTLETYNVDLDASYTRQHLETHPGPYVMIAISDTGCGMDSDTQARLFEPFFTTKAQGKGTGLGLSTVYGIVKQSGGSIWVYSELGQGSTFKIYFPCVTEPVDTMDRRPLPVQSTQGWETILLVEDEEAVRTFVTHVLRTNGYTVLQTSHASEALQLCEQYAGTIHLLLTDVVIPGMNGLELAQRLLSLRPSLQVLYMSGYTNNVIVHHGILDANTHFLQKPLNVNALTHKLREMLDAPAV